MCDRRQYKKWDPLSWMDPPKYLVYVPPSLTGPTLICKRNGKVCHKSSTVHFGDYYSFHPYSMHLGGVWIELKMDGVASKLWICAIWPHYVSPNFLPLVVCIDQSVCLRAISTSPSSFASFNLLSFQQHISTLFERSPHSWKVI